MSDKPSLLGKFTRRKPVWVPANCDTDTLFGEKTVVATSEAQREIFAASMLDADASRAYNHCISIFFEGKLDVDALYSCLLNLLKRHEALRGSFSADGEKFRIREGVGFEMPVVNLEAVAASEQQSSYDRFIRQELAHVFDLVRGPLFRSNLVRYSRRKWTLVFNCHHAVVDGWSLNTILSDLPKLYTALVTGQTESNLEPVTSFVEYLTSTVAREKETSASVKQFWKRVFSDGVPVLDLPLDKPRPKERTYNCRREDYKIDRKVYERLKDLGVKNGTSQFATLLAAFALYLHRISGQDDHLVGVPSAGQIISGKSKLLGHDARIMPIRCLLQTSDTFKTYSNRVMQNFFAAYENQWISMPELMSELKVRQDPARVPFVSVIFSFDPGMSASDFHFEDLKAHHFFNHRNFETFEIAINAVVEHGDMVLECAYNADLFDAAEMHERLLQFEKLMASITEAPELPVAKLEILTTRQIQDMDRALNSTQMQVERGVCVDQLIERMVRNTPTSVAVEYGDISLSYEEIWARAGKIANAVLRAGLGPKPLVGVMVERTENLVSILLGVWRAGGTFVPLDPAYPLDRLQYMVTHSAIRLVLSQDIHMGALQIEGVDYLDIAKILATASTAIAASVIRDPKDLAYVIYTSGSTGKPKGVKVPQHTLVNFLCSMQKQGPGITAADHMLAITTISFDIAELELWLPLISGARTVIVDRATSIDGMALIKLVKEKKITFIQATPGTWRLLLCSEWAGDPKLKALCGGEALPKELADEILSRVGTLWNVYGPTETTVWSTIDQVGPGPITIGKPLGNQLTYILDANGSWAPRGVVGELWLGGDGVTDGYFGRDDLTVERFVPNTFTGKGNIYKTGDLVRLRQDGRIEFVGRNDFQVKVRGYRIELGEVQYALAQHPSVRQCVVVVKNTSPGDAQLVAYYSLKPGKKAKPAELKDAMKGHVPDYMLPGYFMELGEMPLTNNGKVNVKALPEPEAFAQGASSENEFLPPKTDGEIYLARLWAELLGVSRVSKKDQFVDLGGSKFLAIKAAHRIKKDRGTQLSPKLLLTKNLEELATDLGANLALVAAEASDGSHDVVGQPFFFGDPGKQKFGFMHEGHRSANFAVLICPPLGQEYMRTHWMTRNICAALNRKGLPVMRFDFYGQGDSAGTPEVARLGDLCDSIVEAAEELRARTGVREIKIVAFRAAGLIVDQVRERLGLCTKVIVVDPILSGREYLDGLRTTQNRRWSNHPFKKKSIKTLEQEELLGCLRSTEWVREMEGIKVNEKSQIVALSPIAAVGWGDYRRLEQVWMSPDVIRKILSVLFGESI